MATHDLKVWPLWFERIADGTKTFEVRKDDRGYQAGDVLVLREYNLDRCRVGCSSRSGLLGGHREGPRRWFADTVDAWVCPNNPPCPHAGFVHDIYELGDPSPTCCIEGCGCGRGESRVPTGGSDG